MDGRRAPTWPISLFLCAACGGAGPPAQPVAAAEAPAPPSTSPGATASAVEADAGQGEPAAAAGTEPAGENEPSEPTVAEVCAKLCERQQAKCSEAVAKKCRGRCLRYVRLSPGCEAETREALTCQTEAKDAPVCANYAARSCLESFRKLKACHAGERPTQSASPESKSAPPGFKVIVDEELGITVALPENAQLDASEARRTWKGEADNVTYVVALLKPPPADLAEKHEKHLVRMAIDYVGYRCQRGLRVHATFHSNGITGARYHSRCADGSEWHGMIRARGGQALSVGYHAPAGKTGIFEPYLKSFDYYQP
jgi:hypothetical protein